MCYSCCDLNHSIAIHNPFRYLINRRLFVNQAPNHVSVARRHVKTDCKHGNTLVQYCIRAYVKNILSMVKFNNLLKIQYKCTHITQ